MKRPERLMDVNVIFYTFSTIAQTLAGAIALLGAFVLYRLQLLNGDIESDSNAVMYGYMMEGVNQAHRAEIGALHDEARYREVLDFAMKNLLPEGLPQATTEKVRLSRNLNQKVSLLRIFWISLWLTVGLIAISVIFLTTAPLIAYSNTRSIVVLAGGLIWFCACLCSYGALIRKTLQ
jgi:hypothetical protein